VDVSVGGELVVSAQRDGRWDLYMLWNGGASALPLTHDSAVEGQVAWSRDLARIANEVLGGGAGTRSALWVANVDGSGARSLTDDSAQAQWPSWAGPESHRIVFEWNRGGRPQIWRYDFTSDTSGTLRQLTTSAAPCMAPSASPDGRKVVFLSLRETSPGGRPTYGIYQVDAEGGEERLLISGGRLDQPSFAPDGGAILFLRDEGTSRAPSKRVYRLRLGQSPDSAVALTPASLYVQTYSMSADGTRLALGVLETAPGGGQLRRGVLYDLAAQAHSPLTPVPSEALAGPVMRPGTSVPPPAPAAQQP
jgi:TolB protein